jgi:Rrf2 family protein
MDISAKIDYAVRILLELAAREHLGTVTIGMLVAEQALPPSYTVSILSEMRRGGLVRARRRIGGWELARPANEITVADIIQVAHGSLFQVVGVPPNDLKYDGAAKHLSSLWVAVESGLRRIFEETTLQDILDGSPLLFRRAVP